jgi:eukaryotic-like serine/threonine-protein kinase
MLARGAVDRYALVRKIASGGMATVYLGRASRPLGHESVVAIKVCHPHLLDAHRRAALLDEARVAARIRHPNVVATLDTVSRDDTVWIVMEHVDGLTVAGLLREGALPVDLALSIAKDTLAGLHAVHAIDVVHRDVSPQNILVGVDGVAKLADFGVFKGRERIAPSTETGDLKGKLGYVAPEVYRGETITTRVDLYALGVVLWEMLAGRRLFEEDTHAALMHRALRGWVPPLASIRGDVPAEIDGILARTLAVDPADRWASAEELARALDTLPSKSALRSTVGERVRRAMRASPPAVDHDSLTPHEYVTPVRPTRARPWRTATTIVAATAALSLLVATPFVVVVGKRRPPASASLPVPVTSAAPITAPQAPVAIAVSALPSASAAAPVKPRTAKPKRPVVAKPFYDPEAP